MGMHDLVIIGLNSLTVTQDVRIIYWHFIPIKIIWGDPPIIFEFCRDGRQEPTLALLRAPMI